MSTLAVGLFVASTHATPGHEAASATPVAVVAFVPDFGASDPEMDTGASAAQPTLTATLTAEVAAAVATPAHQETAIPAATSTQVQQAAEAAAPAATPAQQAPAAVLVAAPAQEPVEVAQAAAMSLPAGYSVEVSLVGCLANGICPFGETPANFYWAPTHTAVVYPNQSAWTLEHEACHAHQHFVIESELGVAPVMPYDLHEWLTTGEAQTWASQVTTAWPATGQWAVEPGAHNAIEDFGISCGLYESDPQQLQQIDPIRYAAMVSILG